MDCRDSLIGTLHEAQRLSGNNWLSSSDIETIAGRYGLSIAATRGVASYYSMFSLRPRGRHVIRLCASPVCHMLGSANLLDTVAKAIGASSGETDPSGEFTLETTQCLGRCAGGPSMMLDDRVYSGLDPAKIMKIISDVRAGDEGAAEPDEAIFASHIGPAHGRRIALRYPLSTDPTDAGEYELAGGYVGLRKAMSIPPDAVVDELLRAKVRGRGGAGFPTGLKDRAAAGSACSAEEGCERYVICNADEGEPGTFKDRIIMERSPQLLIEGMLISAYAIGARSGFIYVRGEYDKAIERLQSSIRSAYRAGFLGSRICGSDFAFDLELRKGAGSYLCGEELTLIESLEGKRGYPRIKPPFPAESGLWGKPTLVNNVETLAALPWVIEHGADEYLSMGTTTSPGTKLFCVSGDVAKPGYGEWELGVRLGDIVAAAGGAIDTSGRPAVAPLAVLLGGAAGTFVSGDALDLRMDYDALKSAGATLGSGAIIVLGPGRSILESISSIMDFFKHESCGKCIPCRVGTARLAAAARLLAEAMSGGASDSTIRSSLASLAEDAESIAKTSLCPLGQSPVLSLRSAVRNLENLR